MGNVKCVIAGGGDPCRITKEDALYIAADSGYRLFEQNGIVPDIIVGDFDSAVYPQGFGGEVIAVACEKDDTDTMLAVKKGLGLGCLEFDIYGGTGGRLSHTLANIQTLEFIHKHGGRGRIISEKCVVSLQFAGEKCEYSRCGYLSVLALEPSVISIDGAKYSGRFSVDRDFPLGVSNYNSGSAVIEVINGAVIVTEEF